MPGHNGKAEGGGGGEGEKAPLLQSSGEWRHHSYGSESHDHTQSEKELESSSASIKLKKNFTLLHAIGAIVGNVVGSGIFVSVQGVAVNAGSVGVSLLLWIFNGLYPIGVGLCYAELGTVIPKAGGEYTFIHEVLGPVPGFVCGWINMLVASPCSNAVIGQASALYITQALGLQCRNDLQLIISICLLTLLAFVNCASIRVSSRLTTLLSGFKIAILSAIIITGIVLLVQGNTQNFQKPFEGTSTDFALIATGFLECAFTYTGWEVISIVSEEVHNPKRNLPLSLTLALLTVTSVYVMVNVAYFTVLSPGDMADTAAVAMTFAARAVGPVGVYVMAVCVVLSCTGGLTTSYLCESRIIFAAGRNGDAPAVAAMLHLQTFSPVVGIIVMCVLNCAYLGVPVLDQLMQIASLAALLKQVLCVIALLHHRRIHPQQKRPFKVPLWLAVLMLVVEVCVIVLAVISQPVLLGLTLVACLTGVPAYYLRVLLARSPIVNSFVRAATRFLQKVLLLCPESKKSR